MGVHSIECTLYAMWEIPAINLKIARVATAGFAAAVTSLAAANSWAPLGPAPIRDGQSEGIGVNPVSGAVQALAPHPSNPQVLYIGSVNGGVWRTRNATAAEPTWERLIDRYDSLSIGDIAYDPTDAQHRTLVAGVGRYSSYGRRGGVRAGLYRTTDDGETWAHLGALAGKNVSAVAPRGATIVVSVDRADSNNCADLGIFRSTDAGESFQQLRAAGEGMPAGRVHAMTADPTDPDVLYASVVFADICDSDDNGIYRSADAGESWDKVSDSALDGAMPNAVSAVEIAVGTANNVYVALAEGGRASDIFRSGDGGATWFSLGVPVTDERGPDAPNPTWVGLHPGGQASLHYSLAADPVDADVFYVGGDRQPRRCASECAFPNSIGARNFSGRLFRGDASKAPADRWQPLTHEGTASGVGPATGSAPHADSRDLAFDAAGDLLEADDGGVYVRTTPESDAGDWFSRNGDLQITEVHSAFFDPVAIAAVAGNQDNGTARQRRLIDRVWQITQQGDGGDVAVDPLLRAAENRSIRYVSSQNLHTPRWLEYDANNALTDAKGLELTVVDGGFLEPQFTTPIAVNQATGGRLVIGAGNGVYESLDLGDTVSEVGPGIRARASGRNTLAYGAAGNPDALYVGAADVPGGLSGGIYVRMHAGAAFQQKATADDVQGVFLDPADPAHAFYIREAGVYRTSNSGDTWADVTGDLPLSDAGLLRSVRLVRRNARAALVVGADRGVFLALAADGFAIWQPVGGDLPHSPVFDLDYGPDQDLLLAGTLGRGVFRLFDLLGAFNNPPVAQPDLAFTNEAVTVEIDVLANDQDPDGELAVATVELTRMPGSGEASVLPDGRVAYTPPEGFAGEVTFEYRVADVDGAYSEPALVTVDVNGRPVALDDQAVTGRGEAVVIDVLINDDDSDGALDPGSLAVVTPPEHGEAVIDEGDVVYTPDPAYAGFDSFEYRVADQQGAWSNAAMVTVAIVPGAEPPFAGDDAWSIPRDRAFRADVSTNDGDPDGDPLTFLLLTAPVSGSVKLSASGTFVYVPSPGFVGADRFVYQVSDGAQEDQATVTLEVGRLIFADGFELDD